MYIIFCILGATEYAFSTYGLGAAAYGAGANPPPGMHVTEAFASYSARIATTSRLETTLSTQTPEAGQGFVGPGARARLSNLLVSDRIDDAIKQPQRSLTILAPRLLLHRTTQTKRFTMPIIVLSRRPSIGSVTNY